jgi:hypothetical protein
VVTVLAVYNSDGCVGRCDANCYAARRPICHCICGGKNHGAGFQAAVVNNELGLGLKSEDLARFAEAHGRDPRELHVIDRLAVKNARDARLQARTKLSQADLFNERRW